MTQFTFDTLHVGRSLLDLYANEVGAPFPQIKSFAAYVGGSPTNICVGAQRLGLKTALLTAIGADPVGDFIMNFLQEEGVNTQFVARKPGYRTSAAVLGIEPPDRFPLVYYRENCADIQLSIDDVLRAPIGQSRVLQFAGTNLSKDPCRSATLFAVEFAHQRGSHVFLDLDFRPDQWHDPRAFGVAIRSVLPWVHIVAGTEDELNAAMLTDPGQVSVEHSQVSDARVGGDLAKAIESLLSRGPKIVLQKRGAQGVRLHRPDCPPLDAPGFPVKIYNILGAGDAFAAGFLFGYINGWDLYRAARLGNACGAIVVTRHGCSKFMPRMSEVMALVDEQGGF